MAGVGAAVTSSAPRALRTEELREEGRLLAIIPGGILVSFFIRLTLGGCRMVAEVAALAMGVGTPTAEEGETGPRGTGNTAELLEGREPTTTGGREALLTDCRSESLSVPEPDALGMKLPGGAFTIIRFAGDVLRGGEGRGGDEAAGRPALSGREEGWAAAGGSAGGGAGSARELGAAAGAEGEGGAATFGDFGGGCCSGVVERVLVADGEVRSPFSSPVRPRDESEETTGNGSVGWVDGSRWCSSFVCTFLSLWLFLPF